jgi:2,3-bisphosphoglycerate-dependent phosphoglycerate mutase
MKGRVQMNTTVYMVRHADSPFCLENERNRELSVQGKRDSEIINEIFNERIDYIFSSPYIRALQTIKPLADRLMIEPIIVKDFRETLWAGNEIIITNFMETVEQYFSNHSFRLEGGESILEAQDRGVNALKKILLEHHGKTLLIGVHGNILTFIMNFFDPQYSFDFWKQLSLPDIYKLEFKELNLSNVERVWKPNFEEVGNIS